MCNAGTKIRVQQAAWQDSTAASSETAELKTNFSSATRDIAAPQWHGIFSSSARTCVAGQHTPPASMRFRVEHDLLPPACGTIFETQFRRAQAVHETRKEPMRVASTISWSSTLK